VKGSLIPAKFSNINDSHQSSLGFYTTESRTYEGTFKYSLKINGHDTKLNSLAFKRAIIFHNYHPMDIETLAQAKWDDPTSWGCFGMPILESGKFYGLEDRPISELVMDTIAGGSVVFAYSNKVNLNKTSDWLK
jgi:hypothetical protein